jgi:hypothetical protein
VIERQLQCCWLTVSSPAKQASDVRSGRPASRTYWPARSPNLLGVCTDTQTHGNTPIPDWSISPEQQPRWTEAPRLAVRSIATGANGLSYDLEDLLYVGVGNLLMEEVAHRGDEDHPRARPFQRLLQPLRPQLQLKALLVRMPRDAAPALGERLGVAVRAPRRDLLATRDVVPGRLRPLGQLFSASSCVRRAANSATCCSTRRSPATSSSRPSVTCASSPANTTPCSPTV